MGGEMKQQARTQPSFRRRLQRMAVTWMIIFCSIGPGSLRGAIINIYGSFDLVIGENFLLGEAGNEIQSTYLSPAGQVSLTISQSFLRRWEVDIRRMDFIWDPQLQLSIARSSDGAGWNYFSGVSGGTQFISIEEQDSLFFTGWGNRSMIGLQFKLSGLSTQIAAGSYVTTLVYTVIDTF